MNLPRKCGQLYIKFDENNQPEYGFDVVGNQIKKFISLTDKEVKLIILPKLVDDCTFDISSIDEKSPYKLLLYNQKIKMQNYVLGRVKICDGCFKGLKEAKIIVPFENSVMLDWGAFEENAKIELAIHKNLTLKQIYRRFDTVLIMNVKTGLLLEIKKYPVNLAGMVLWVKVSQLWIIMKKT